MADRADDRRVATGPDCADRIGQDRDQRASSLTIADKLLQGPENDDAGHPMDGSRRPLAQPVAGGTPPPPPPGGDSPSRRQLDGDGGRAGERGVDSGTTRPPHSATRYIETLVGILSHQELAPLLAERVADAELTISDRRFADLPLHGLVLDLHRRVCVDLTPEMAGRWRLRDVRVGRHAGGTGNPSPGRARWRRSVGVLGSTDRI